MISFFLIYISSNKVQPNKVFLFFTFLFFIYHLTYGAGIVRGLANVLLNKIPKV